MDAEATLEWLEDLRNNRLYRTLLTSHTVILLIEDAKLLRISAGLHQ